MTLNDNITNLSTKILKFVTHASVLKEQRTLTSFNQDQVFLCKSCVPMHMRWMQCSAGYALADNRVRNDSKKVDNNATS